MKQLSREKSGEIMILCETLMYSLFPIIVAHSTKILPPILFAGLSTMTAAVSLFVFLLIGRKLKSLANKEMLKYTLGITLFIIIIPSILIFTGSSKTSGINTTILLQSEIVFTFIIFGLFAIEKITLSRVLGAFIVLLGTVFIIYNGSREINTGDLLMIAGTFFYPIGNIFAKKALKVGDPSAILFVRSFLGGIVLIGVSLIFENQTSTMNKISDHWPLILLSGVFIYHLSKILWYEGIKRIDISKATTISTGGYPAFSLLFAFLFLKEIPTIYQLIGFATIILGIFVLIRKDKKMEPVRME
ncbi:MAG: DMT family transporter [Candidatus Peregrinibacteria bacterium]